MDIKLILMEFGKMRAKKIEEAVIDSQGYWQTQTNHCKCIGNYNDYREW